MPVASLLIVPRPGHESAAEAFISSMSGHRIIDTIESTYVVLCDHPDQRKVREAWDAIEAHPAVASLTLTYVALDDEEAAPS